MKPRRLIFPHFLSLITRFSLLYLEWSISVAVSHDLYVHHACICFYVCCTKKNQRCKFNDWMNECFTLLVCLLFKGPVILYHCEQCVIEPGKMDVLSTSWDWVHFKLTTVKKQNSLQKSWKLSFLHKVPNFINLHKIENDILDTGDVIWEENLNLFIWQNSNKMSIFFSAKPSAVYSFKFTPK